VVDSGVRGDITVSSLRDQDAFRAKHAHALVEHHLDHSGIRLRDQPARDLHRLRAGGHVVEVDNPALRLRHHLLRHHQHVTGFESRAGRNQFGQVVSRLHLGQPFDAEQLESLHTARLKRSRSEGSSRSNAIASE